MLIGYLLGIAIASALSALFIKLFARLIVKKSVGFVSAFVISFISFIAAIFMQDLIAHKQEAFWAASPAAVFFLVCWLLNAQFLKYDGAKEEISYGKKFLVTLLQSAALFFALMILSLVFVSGLMMLGSRSS